MKHFKFLIINIVAFGSLFFLISLLFPGHVVTAKTVSIATNVLKAAELSVWWFNPKNMEIHKVGIVKNSGNVELTSPTSGIDNDWVLVIDDASKKFKEPGK